jgi:hypothetical protein
MRANNEPIIVPVQQLSIQQLQQLRGAVWRGGVAVAR